ncbi:HNH endonuclease signature motif containing protein [Polaromonas sp.]|uniref:HNH endonuclease signature motif containing protein n=1 Tax=Polaromonas sp. TaxID=1869339 RepID=UPI0037530AD5
MDRRRAPGVQAAPRCPESAGATVSNKLITNFQEYVEGRSVRLPWSGCHIWLGSANGGGYGTSQFAGRVLGTTIVHRALFQHLNGAVPRGAYICHECDTPSCVNPSHLFLGTPTDNARDRANKGRSAPKYGEFSGRAKLTTLDVLEIRRLRLMGAPLPGLASTYRVSTSTILNAATGRTWRSL